MKANSYLAIGYACNESCRCCPLIEKDSRKKIISLIDLKKDISKISKLGITDITISGGEPTIHPNFFEILDFCLSKKLEVHILSNGEKFSDNFFTNRFLEIAQKGKVSITTTFHSSNAKEHEYQNQSQGSFYRSINGLKHLYDKGINISIKHCITKYNYKDLSRFLEYIMNYFSKGIEIQLWGIDLYGIDASVSKRFFIPFNTIKPYIENAIEYFEKKNKDDRFFLSINNIPLCTCDCYYWMYFNLPYSDNYLDYESGGEKLEDNSGAISKNCEKCCFNSICMGTYLSIFRLMGDEIVSPPIYETKIEKIRPIYINYNKQNVKKMFFSPYLSFKLLLDGLYITNYLTSSTYILRLKAMQLLEIQEMLLKGEYVDMVINKLNSYGLNGESLVKELMIKGIIE